MCGTSISLYLIKPRSPRFRISYKSSFVFCYKSLENKITFFFCTYYMKFRDIKKHCNVVTTCLEEEKSMMFYSSSTCVSNFRTSTLFSSIQSPCLYSIQNRQNCFCYVGQTQRSIFTLLQCVHG